MCQTERDLFKEYDTKQKEYLQKQFQRNTFYKGIPTCKNPMDLWVYQEIIHEVKPDVIIEIGVWHGGSTLWLRDNAPESNIIAIDKEFNIGYDVPSSEESGLSLYIGDATDIMQAHIVKTKIQRLSCIYDDIKVLVIEDSSHTYENTLECLKLYSPLVSVGSYYIVEDTIAPELGYDLRPDLAVKDFMKDNDDFIVDKSREKYITWNPGGYLKRVK